VAQTETDRVRHYYDAVAPKFDRQIRFSEAVLFPDMRRWACAGATGDVLEPIDGLDPDDQELDARPIRALYGATFGGDTIYLCARHCREPEPEPVHGLRQRRRRARHRRAAAQPRRLPVSTLICQPSLGCAAPLVPVRA
jgi:hypothetical protein